MKRNCALSFSLSLAATGLAIGLQATPAQAITTWDWSFTTDISDQFGSGTFTTADVVPTANTTYAIIGVYGTYNRGSSVYAITNLSSFNQPDNFFQWDGTSLSSILATEGGISFVAEGLGINIYKLGDGFGPVGFQRTEFQGSDGAITSSSLQPNQNLVPGPLPLFGAAAAYSWSRRLRRRIAEKV
jgi:hypothetical protein